MLCVSSLFAPCIQWSWWVYSNFARLITSAAQARDPLKLLGPSIEAFCDSEGLVSVSIPSGSYVASFSHDLFDPEVVPYELGPPEQVPSPCFPQSFLDKVRPDERSTDDAMSFYCRDCTSLSNE